MELDEMKYILSLYSIEYKMMNQKGVINYGNNTICLNPLFINDVETLYHKLLHHKSDNIDGTYLSEDAKKYFNLNKNGNYIL
jgi:hypothetical protein